LVAHVESVRTRETSGRSVWLGPPLLAAVPETGHNEGGLRCGTLSAQGRPDDSTNKQTHCPNVRRSSYDLQPRQGTLQVGNSCIADCGILDAEHSKVCQSLQVRQPRVGHLRSAEWELRVRGAIWIPRRTPEQLYCG
jgi:hypothetical protein